MNLTPAPEYSIDLITPPTPEATPMSEIVVAGVASGKLLPGAILEAALRWGEYALLFLTDDIPFEDTLRIYLLDRDMNVVDSARMGAMYSTGRFSDLDLRQQDTVRFRFFGGITWTLTLLPRETFAVPVLSEPKGVSRPLSFFRRFRLDGKPLPQEAN